MGKTEFNRKVLQRAGHFNCTSVGSGVEREIVPDAIMGGVNIALFKARRADS